MSERAEDPRLRRRWAREVTILLAVLLAASEALASPFAGRSLESALEELQREGLSIIYSSAVVLPSMRVESEPRQRSPRGKLDEILAPHGLSVREESGHLIVVPVPRDPEGTIRLDVKGAPAAARVSVRIDSRRPLPVSAGHPFPLRLPPGLHSLLIEARGFVPLRVDDVLVVAGEVRGLEVTLSGAAQLLEEVTVTPSHYRLVDQEPQGSHFLSVTEAERLPQVAADPYWAAKTLPGTSHSDLAAAFHIRGGRRDEMLVLLDGVELYEPFHLKDLLPLFSIVDRSAIAGVDLTTGGFSAEYGGRMSGVMEISTMGVSPLNPVSIRVSTTDSSMVTSGILEEPRIHYLAATRAWYPDDVLRAAGLFDQPIVTDYFDSLGKLTHSWSERTTLTAGALGAYDHARYASNPADPRRNVVAQDSTLQLWASAETLWSPSLLSRTAVSAGDLRRDRSGDAERSAGVTTVAEERAFSFAGLKQDWSADLRDRHLLRWGVELKGQRASYDYLSRLQEPAGGPGGIDIETRPGGESYSAYVSDRVRLGSALIAELGVRFDRQHWIEEQQVSPRVSLLYMMGERTLLRAAWGRYAQWQQLNELPVADGVRAFEPAQRAAHWLVSLERRFPSVTGRIEAYEKVTHSPHPYYENLFDDLDLFPESRDDRVRVESEQARARGLELFVKSDPGRGSAWWISYTLSEATDRIDGDTVPRSWDQRHAFGFGAYRRVWGGWEASLAGTVSSGRPGTEMRPLRDASGAIELVPGPRNAIRRASYHRLDGRVSRRFPLRIGSVVVAAELLNLTGRSNVCCITGFTVEESPGGALSVLTEERIYPRFVPSLSVRWDF